MGLAYVDTTVEAGKVYFYTVRPNNAPAGATVKKGTVKIGTDDVYAAPAPSGIEGFPKDSLAIITWEPLPDHYTSYLIDRSDDNGQTWQTVNGKPFIFTSADGSAPSTMRFADSLAQNNSLYVYRVKGCSPFGIIGPPSDTVHVYGRPSPIPVVPTVTGVEEVSNGALKISWGFPSGYENKIQGFEVHRSIQADGGYDKVSASLLAASSRSYTDSSPSPVNYYKVVAIDENNYERASFALMGQPADETPPTAPATLVGKSNSSGVVTLEWAPSKEEDVKGYRVYMSNQQEGNFTQITGPWINDTVYHYGLNLNTLSEEVYFRVKAIDFRENQSGFSPIATVQRPDIIPLPPQISQK